MNKKINSTSLVDEHLESLQEMKEAETDDFFYTRLKAKMSLHPNSKEKISMKWVYATAVAMLVILTINVFVWRNSNAIAKQSSSIQQLVQEYGWARHDLYSNNSN